MFGMHEPWDEQEYEYHKHYEHDGGGKEREQDEDQNEHVLYQAQYGIERTSRCEGRKESRAQFAGMAQKSQRRANDEDDAQSNACHGYEAESDRGNFRWRLTTGSAWQQRMAACDKGDECARDGTHEGMGSIPGMVNEGNLVGNEVEEREKSQHCYEPALSDEGEMLIHFEQLQPANGE